MACAGFIATFRANRNGCKRDRYPDPGGNKITPPVRPKTLSFTSNTAGSFDAVTCSHAFYELKGETQGQALREILRILKPGRVFLIMEHDVPENSLVRALFYIRILSMGAKRALAILKHEKSTLESYFSRVEKVASPSGGSKILICRK